MGKCVRGSLFNFGQNAAAKTDRSQIMEQFIEAVRAQAQAKELSKYLNVESR